MTSILFTALLLAQQPPLVPHTTKDSFNREIHFYIEPAAQSKPPLPLALFILGSGAHSNFLVRDGATLTAHRDFRDLIQGRARLLVVEKPGVPFGSQPTSPGTANGSSDEFRQQHTFPRWLEALSASLQAARQLPGIDASRILVVGHSEGALMAAALAARHRFITHVACLAVGGYSQATDFMAEARQGSFSVQSLKERWKDIRLHPADHNRIWLGHAYPYWATFTTPSIVEQLQSSAAKVFVAQGSLDGTKPLQDLDLIDATLSAQGRNVTALLIEGANHGFQFKDQSTTGRDGWREILSKVITWYFTSPVSE
jgi:predicted esterase